MRETKANLLFLIGFLVLSLPGAVILFNKKLDPAEPAMYLPAPSRDQIPYMAPQVGFQYVNRFVPPVTAAWVRQTAMAQMDATGLYLEDGVDGPAMPAMSRRRQFQVVARTGRGDQQRLGVMVWDDTTDLSYAWLVDGTEVTAGRPEAMQARPLLPSVVKELKDMGFVKPPTAVTWLELPVPGGVLGRTGVTLRLEAADARPAWTDTFEAVTLLESAVQAAAEPPASSVSSPRQAG
ncbi:MAG: hypothetical protein ACFCVE_00855 [Phycisphaerae bacterium]